MPVDKPTLNFKTFGCKVNTYDTGLIQEALEGFDASDPIHVVNTCAVTAEATKEALRHIRKIKRDQPNAKVVVTGCSAQVDGTLLDDVKDIDLIVANSHKEELRSLMRKNLSQNGSESLMNDPPTNGELKNSKSHKKVFRSNIFRNEKKGAGGGRESRHTRSFLKIQDGCNSFCSFCIIPYARGKSRSLSARELATQVNSLYRSGSREVVISGIHIGDYHDPKFSQDRDQVAQLVEFLLDNTPMPRFRISSLEPPELTNELLALYKNPRLCPHFHMSVQSINTKVLKDMKRNYSAEDVIDSFERIRKALPEAYIGMDVIVGFPTETNNDFEETFRNLTKSPWTKIHVFPYSERPGTRAALLEETVPWEVRKERAKRLRTLSLERYNQEALEQVGKTKPVLLLKSSQSKKSVSRDYWSVQLENLTLDRLENIEEQQVRVTGFVASLEKEAALTGELL